jgi:hypothetical protein
MAFHRVEATPNLNLAHLVSTTHSSYWGGSSTTRKYAVRPLGMRRPAEGRTRQAVSCAACGTRVEVVVPSAALTRRRQRFWLAPTAVLLGLVVLGIVYSVLWYPWHTNPFGFILPFTGMFFALVAGLMCLLQARTAHGVTLSARQPTQARRNHSIRYPPRPGYKHVVQQRRRQRQSQRRR